MDSKSQSQKEQRIIKNRWSKKKDKISLLSENMQRLKYNVSLDLKSDNEKVFLTALVVAMMLKTAERVGNEKSADNGHFGITGLRKKHINIIGDKILLEYVGKSGVEHSKYFSDKRIAKALKLAKKNSKSKSIFVTSDGFKIKSDRVNRYLSDFGITAKDIRGYSANNYVIKKLSDLDIEETDSKRQRQFNKVVRSVADKVGHGYATLKNHYLVPEIEPNFVKNSLIVSIEDIGKYANGGTVGESDVSSIESTAKLMDNIDAKKNKEIENAYNKDNNIDDSIIYYHGTNSKDAKSIKSEGFRKENKYVSLTTDFNEAEEYAKQNTDDNGGVPIVIKLRLKKGAKPRSIKSALEEMEFKVGDVFLDYSEITYQQLSESYHADKLLNKETELIKAINTLIGVSDNIKEVDKEVDDKDVLIGLVRKKNDDDDVNELTPEQIDKHNKIVSNFRWFVASEDNVMEFGFEDKDEASIVAEKLNNLFYENKKWKVFSLFNLLSKGLKDPRKDFKYKKHNYKKSKYKKSLFNSLYKEHHDVWDEIQLLQDKVSDKNSIVYKGELLELWEKKLYPHFKEEESVLFPFLREKELSVDVDMLMSEHELLYSTIRILIRSENAIKDKIIFFCEELKKHIKFEEAVMSKFYKDPYECDCKSNGGGVSDDNKKTENKTEINLENDNNTNHNVYLDIINSDEFKKWFGRWDIIVRAKELSKNIKGIYSNIFLENTEQVLFELAQQAITSDGAKKGAILVAGDELISLALELFPNISVNNVYSSVVSKIVDENGYPLIVYHGTMKDFSVFNMGDIKDDEWENIEGSWFRSGADPTAFVGSHFAKEKSVAQKFTTRIYAHESGDGRLLKVFLDIRNPYIIKENLMQEEIRKQNLYEHFVFDYLLDTGDELLGIDMEDVGDVYKSNIEKRKEINDYALNLDKFDSLSLAYELGQKYKYSLIKEGYDGIIYENIVEGGTSYIAFRPNQIKIADGSNKVFSMSDDIYLNKGGEMMKSGGVFFPKGETAYDKQARLFILDFLNRKKEQKKLIKFYNKETNGYKVFVVYDKSVPSESSIYIVDSVEKAYNTCLNLDVSELNIVKAEKVGDKLYYDYYNGDLFGDYNGEYYDDKGVLKSDVKNGAMELIKKYFNKDGNMDNGGLIRKKYSILLGEFGEDGIWSYLQEWNEEENEYVTMDFFDASYGMKFNKNYEEINEAMKDEGWDGSEFMDYAHGEAFLHFNDYNIPNTDEYITKENTMINSEWGEEYTFAEMEKMVEDNRHKKAWIDLYDSLIHNKKREQLDEIIKSIEEKIEENKALDVDNKDSDIEELEEMDIRRIVNHNFASNGRASESLIESYDDMDNESLKSIILSMEAARSRHMDTDYDSISKKGMTDEQVSELRKNKNMKVGGNIDINNDIDNDYLDYEYEEGGEVRSLDIITKKIGLIKEHAEYIISLNKKLAIWIADSIVKDVYEKMHDTKLSTKENKELALKKINENVNYIRHNYPTQIRVILDWLLHPLTEKQDLRKLSWTSALEKARIFHEELSVMGGDIDFVEPKENLILNEYALLDDGTMYYWVFINKNFCGVESSRMGHCGRTGYGNALISLRSVKPYGKEHTISDSHVTIAYGSDGYFYQVKGKKNQKPSQKYFPFIYDLIMFLLSDEYFVSLKATYQKEYDLLENVLSEDKSVIYKNVSESNLIKSKIDILDELIEKRFAGFGSEYQSSQDYGFSDMSIYEFRRIVEIRPDVLSDLKLNELSEEHLRIAFEYNPSMFDNFYGQLVLYDAGIIEQSPDTEFIYEEECKYINIVEVCRNYRDDLITTILCGDMFDVYEGYWRSDSEVLEWLDYINDENKKSIEKRISEITGIELDIVSKNGIEYYLDDSYLEEDDAEDFDFSEIIHAINRALASAEESDYYSHLYNELKKSFSEYGEVLSMNDEGVKIKIDLKDFISTKEIGELIQLTGVNDLQTLFKEAIGNNDIEISKFCPDERYTASPDKKEFNDILSGEDYKKGGIVKAKKNKYFKPFVPRIKDGGNLIIKNKKVYSKDMPIKEMSLEESSKYMCIYHESVGNFLVAKNKFFLWFYSVPDCGSKIESGEYDFLMFPLPTRRMGQSIVDDIWKPRFQKSKGAKNLLGMVEGYYDENNKKIYVMYMSVRPSARRNKINTHMIKFAKHFFKVEDVEFDNPTKQGSEFMHHATYKGGGNLRSYLKIEKDGVCVAVFDYNVEQDKDVLWVDLVSAAQKDGYNVTPISEEDYFLEGRSFNSKQLINFQKSILKS